MSKNKEDVLSGAPYTNYEPFQYILKMKDEGKYIEAIMILYAYVDQFLGDLVIIYAYKNAKESGYSQNKVNEIVSKMNFDQKINLAVCLGAINSDLYADVRSFQRERNDLVHKFTFGKKRYTNKHLKSVIDSGVSIFGKIIKMVDERLSHD